MSKTVLDELKAKYDSKEIKTIEHEIGVKKEASVHHRMEMIKCLYYLERTSRWRENRLYAKSSFGDYLYNLFAIRHGTYESEKLAFIGNPKESIELGPGIVIKARKSCGPIKMEPALKDIKLSNRKPETIKKIISKYAPKKEPKAQKTVTIAELQAEISRKDKKIVELLSEIKEKDEMITRLRKALLSAKAAIETSNVMPAIIAKQTEKPCRMNA